MFLNYDIFFIYNYAKYLSILILEIMKSITRLL